MQYHEHHRCLAFFCLLPPVIWSEFFSFPWSITIFSACLLKRTVVSTLFSRVFVLVILPLFGTVFVNADYSHFRSLRSRILGLCALSFAIRMVFRRARLVSYRLVGFSVFQSALANDRVARFARINRRLSPISERSNDSF